MSSQALADIPALISSRICHDLINPIGAISNGLELLGETKTQPLPELELVQDSTEIAKAKIAFFRFAFSNFRDEEETVAATVGQVIAAMYPGGRFRPSWSVEDTSLMRGEVKLALLLLMCTEVSLKVGGNCRISREGEEWMLATTGPKIAPDERLWGFVTGNGEGDGEISPREVQFVLAGETAKRLGRQVSMSAGEAGMSVSF